MKSIKLITVFTIAVLFAFQSNAQKIGYVNVEGLVYSLPEIQRVQETLQKYSADSVGGEYERLNAEAKRKDSIVKNTTSKPLKEAAQKDLADIVGTLQNWQQIGGQLIEGKKAELLSPLYKRVMDAVNAVAKEKGYAYVLTQEAFFVAPDSDNLSIPVATRLGIKIPTTPAAGGAARPATR